MVVTTPLLEISISFFCWGWVWVNNRDRGFYFIFSYRNNWLQSLIVYVRSNIYLRILFWRGSSLRETSFINLRNHYSQVLAWFTFRGRSVLLLYRNHFFDGLRTRGINGCRFRFHFRRIFLGIFYFTVRSPSYSENLGCRNGLCVGRSF